MVDITGLDKVVILRKLWENSLYPSAQEFDQDKAQRVVGGCVTDFCGRSIEVNFNDRSLFFHQYNRELWGRTSGEEIIFRLFLEKEQETKKKEVKVLNPNQRYVLCGRRMLEFTLATKHGVEFFPSHGRSIIFSRLSSKEFFPDQLKNIVRKEFSSTFVDFSYPIHQSHLPTLDTTSNLFTLYLQRNCSSPKDVNFCEFCEEETRGKLKTRKRCHTAVYCSPKCRILDWKQEHSKVCAGNGRVKEDIIKRRDEHLFIFLETFIYPPPLRRIISSYDTEKTESVVVWKWKTPLPFPPKKKNRKKGNFNVLSAIQTIYVEDNRMNGHFEHNPQDPYSGFALSRSTRCRFKIVQKGRGSQSYLRVLGNKFPNEFLDPYLGLVCVCHARNSYEKEIKILYSVAESVVYVSIREDKKFLLWHEVFQCPILSIKLWRTGTRSAVLFLVLSGMENYELVAVRFNFLNDNEGPLILEEKVIYKSKKLYHSCTQNSKNLYVISFTKEGFWLTCVDMLSYEVRNTTLPYSDCVAVSRMESPGMASLVFPDFVLWSTFEGIHICRRI